MSVCRRAVWEMKRVSDVFPAGCDHRRPGRRHRDHPRMRPHLPAARAAPPADPDPALHGKS